ncbi:HRDC domain-containing protein [Deinococcus sp. A31D244]|uniref:HRDC domain-containing protein n=1 Tax=Deinococcus sp. A31D244 TaxID=3397675 RepID=UPI0039DF313C
MTDAPASLRPDARLVRLHAERGDPQARLAGALAALEGADWGLLLRDHAALARQLAAQLGSGTLRVDPRVRFNRDALADAGLAAATLDADWRGARAVWLMEPSADDLDRARRAGVPVIADATLAPGGDWLRRGAALVVYRDSVTLTGHGDAPLTALFGPASCPDVVGAPPSDLSVSLALRDAATLPLRLARAARTTAQLAERLGGAAQPAGPTALLLAPDAVADTTAPSGGVLAAARSVSGGVLVTPGLEDLSVTLALLQGEAAQQGASHGSSQQGAGQQGAGAAPTGQGQVSQESAAPRDPEAAQGDAARGGRGEERREFRSGRRDRPDRGGDRFSRGRRDEFRREGRPDERSEGRAADDRSDSAARGSATQDTAPRDGAARDLPQPDAPLREDARPQGRPADRPGERGRDRSGAAQPERVTFEAPAHAGPAQVNPTQFNSMQDNPVQENPVQAVPDRPAAPVTPAVVAPALDSAPEETWEPEIVFSDSPSSTPEIAPAPLPAPISTGSADALVEDAPVEAELPDVQAAGVSGPVASEPEAPRTEGRGGRGRSEGRNEGRGAGRGEGRPDRGAGRPVRDRQPLPVADVTPVLLTPDLPGGREDPAADLSDEQAEVYARLRDWRNAEAKRQEISRFIVASNATLAEIARRVPYTEADLHEVRGMGPERLRKYGEKILEIVRG